MKFITGENRRQIPLFASSIDEAISKDNEVRLIDLFVGSLKLEDYGFTMDFIENGRPAYHPSDLLKLYIYGYMNRMRSSRALEKECNRNIELMWLLKGLVPDHNTISNFRRDNPKAIRKVFHATVNIAKNFELIGGKLLAGDSTKLRAQNSKKNNFTPAKIEKHIEYIDNKLREYADILASEDKDSLPKEEVKKIDQKVEKHKQQKQNYVSMQNQLEQSGEVQISTSDPESRQLITRNNITEVCYNVQTTVDSKFCIPIDYKVTNENDSKAMGGMVRRAKSILKTEDITILYDKGYHTGDQFAYAHEQGVEVMVAIPAVASHAPDIKFDVENFKYDKEQDAYICPANEVLTTNGNWYNKDRGKSVNKVKHYKTSACISCQFFTSCTKNQKGRLIERSEYADLIYANKKRIESNKETYKKRQAIVEHPYGIIKRQWDFSYIMTKQTINRASADVGLIFVAFNLRRIFNLIDKNTLKEFLRKHALIFQLLSAYFNAFYRQIIFQIHYTFLSTFVFIVRLMNLNQLSFLVLDDNS